MSSTDTLTRQMHESRARRLIAAETRAAAAALWLGGRQ